MANVYEKIIKEVGNFVDTCGKLEANPHGTDAQKAVAGRNRHLGQQCLDKCQEIAANSDVYITGPTFSNSN